LSGDFVAHHNKTYTLSPFYTEEVTSPLGWFWGAPGGTVANAGKKPSLSQVGHAFEAVQGVRA
jgi:hypothetical protein